VSRFISHVPIIYRLNMRQPDGFFLAERFPVRDKDVLFVSNAQSVELTKLLNVIDLAAVTGTDVDALRIAIRSIR
jgi:polysaccharide export outer membrane protein